jgi:hypothetical protein
MVVSSMPGLLAEVAAGTGVNSCPSAVDMSVERGDNKCASKRNVKHKPRFHFPMSLPQEFEE